ncbi:MAG: thermonuclease family protein [Tagaea sp.]|nr:thermonuclease family protein [Tagaea sp.]
MFRFAFGFVLLAVGAACAPGAAIAPAAAETCHAIDGDTIQCVGRRVRLVNVDTPELHGQCPAEIALAYRALDFTAGRLAAGEIEIVVDAHRPKDRYGRTLAWVLVDGRDVGEDLIAAGLARRWDGRRRPWC